MNRTAHSALITAFLLSFLSFPAIGRTQLRYKYNFNENCRKAYEEIIQLKVVAGNQLLEEEKKAHPDNLIPYFLDNYIDFFTLFFNEDPVEFRRRKPSMEQRLTLMKKGDPVFSFLPVYPISHIFSMGCR